MAFTDTLARGLQGFGAGVAGRGQEFLADLDDKRKNAMLQDSFKVMQFLEAGDAGSARETLVARLDAIQQLGGDPTDTQSVLQKLEAGDLKGALVDVSTVVDFAVAEGLLKAPPTPARQIVDGQVVSVDPRTGAATAAPIEGFAPSAGKTADRDLRERQIAVAEATEQRQATKLSAGLESALLKAQDRTVEAQRSANELDLMANDFERLNLEGGLASTVTETFKNILGSQDAVSELRRKFNQVRVSQGLKNLPPGPASDKDVQMAFKGVPKESASAEQVASFLRGAARLARFDAGFNQFKSDFISKKSTGKGINQLWRKQIESPALERSVSIAEIYETAQNRNTTPEEIAQQLGITTGLF